ncbi:hypothetical protein EC968_008824 [Mortierella alpina]|nr:hypothetical protein EC968_008824 [Mortierella alpina]
MTKVDRAVTSARLPQDEHDPVPAMNATDSSSSTSPPVTPPTKSLGEDVRTLVRSSLPSPPPSSSSKHVRAYTQAPILDKDQGSHPDQDQDQDQDQAQDRNGSGIDKMVRRLSPPAVTATRPRSTSASHPSARGTSAGAINKTHSSSSSLSSSASNPNLPSTLTNKHVALAKTKTLGHLTRSTSSEVDNEVAHALASGRIIMSKTDWKEEDAQFLVQLIETQFPKGNIIWDWVGQQMTSRGFTKNQCRSKWKRIRTKVLHGGDQPTGRDKETRDHFRDQEPDELIEEEEDELADQQEYMHEQRQEPRRWNHRPDQRPETTRTVEAAAYRKERHYSPAQPYDRHHHDGYYYNTPVERRDDHRFRSSPAEPPMSSYRSSASHQPNRHLPDRVSIEEDELLSDDDLDGRQDRVMTMDPTQREYSDRQLSHGSRPHQLHYRQHSNSTMVPEDYVEESSRPIPAIAATPITFGKIEWKPEDSDYLVRLIESKFASRKVDWAWVSKQMEGRGYDRTQCKSRWWRVQHRQNQSGQHPAQPSHHGSASQLAARGRQRQSLDPSAGDYDSILASSRHKSVMSDVDGGEAMGDDQRSSRQGSTADRENTRGRSQSPSFVDSSTARPQKGFASAKSKEAREEDDGRGGMEDRASSPRTTRGHEHQKHIEWKEEDSQYMYRMIEKEFPVGNVVWSVIGERMANRGYSQTQCMSKWRRHLKNNKLSHDGTKASASMDMDMDIDLDLDGSLTATHSENTPRSFGLRQRAEEEQIHSEDRDDVSKRYKIDGGDSRRYEKDIEYRSALPLDAQLVEQEYDRYYDAGGKRKRARNQGSLTQADSLRHERGAVSSHDDRYEGWPSRDIIEGSDPHSVDRGRERGLSKDIALNRDHGDDSPTEPQYVAHRHHRQGHSKDYSREQADATVEEQENHQQSARDPYFSKSTSGRNGSSQYSQHGETSLSAEARHRLVDHDGTHSTGRKRMPRVDEGENRFKERPPVDWDRRRQYERYDDSYDRHHRRSIPSMDYDNDYSRDYGSGYSGSHPHHYDRHHSRRTAVEEDRLAGLIDPALEDDMDWAFGRYESHDMARLAAAVARQGRRWDAIRAQIRMPILVSPYDDQEDVLYEGTRFDPHPAVVHHQLEEPSRPRHSHHRSASSTSVSYYSRPPPSAAFKHTSSRFTATHRHVAASNHRKVFSSAGHAKSSIEPPVELSDAMQVDLTIDAPEDEPLGSKEDPVIDVESIEEEAVDLGNDDASKYSDPSADKDLALRGEDVGPEEAEMDRIESREAMDEDDAEAGSSEQQVKALDVQVEELAV